VNVDVFIGFMQQCTKSRTRKVYLIVDNLKVYHGKIVKS